MGRSPRLDLDDQTGSPVADEPVDTGSANRPRGRPKTVPGPCASLSVYLPTASYDRLVVLADQRKQSVSAFVREWLVLLTGGRDTDL